MLLGTAHRGKIPTVPDLIRDLNAATLPCQTLPRAYLTTMRLAFTLILLASPAAAWEFRATPICTLAETGDAGNLTVTYDASLPEYTITITLPDATWPDAPAFAMGFAGDRPINIQTDRHSRSADGRSLTVKDTGFGNVLNGLEFNMRVYASSGDMTIGFDLTGITPAIRDFRNCPDANLA